MGQAKATEFTGPAAPGRAPGTASLPLSLAFKVLPP